MDKDIDKDKDKDKEMVTKTKTKTKTRIIFSWTKLAKQPYKGYFPHLKGLSSEN